MSTTLTYSYASQVALHSFEFVWYDVDHIYLQFSGGQSSDGILEALNGCGLFGSMQFNDVTSDSFDRVCQVSVDTSEKQYTIADLEQYGVDEIYKEA